jgi:hypothetical protein
MVLQISPYSARDTIYDTIYAYLKTTCNIYHATPSHSITTLHHTHTPDLTAAWKAPRTAALPPISVFIPAMLVVGVLMERPPVS